jgi:glutamine synthetase
MGDFKETLETLKQTDSTKIFFTDLHGRIMSLPVNPNNMESICNTGIGFDGSSIAGFASVEKSDRLLKPVKESFRLVKLADEKVGFFNGDVYNEAGKRSLVDPRAVLENILAEAEAEFGYKFIVGPEYEFFLLKGDKFDENSHTDRGGYFQASPHDKGEAVRHRIINVLKECGIVFEKSHHEVTPSQHEINLECTDPLNGADRTVLFNYVTQKVATEFGYYAAFMPKPFNGYNRNAFHIHISMQDLDGNNVFYDETAEKNIGKIARQFIAGILKYARETSIIMASTFNSYKAYVLEREAPIVRNWGFSNRSSMVRIPHALSPQSTRLELRSPDPCGNPYLQIAVLIAMGLAGIKQGLDCGPPISGSAYRKAWKMKVWDKRFLPKCMYEALVEAERSKFLKETLGERLYENYMALKVSEWEDHRTHVTPLEHSKYLNR